MIVPRPALRSGFWVLRCSALGPRFSILGIGYWVLGTENCELGSGCPIATSALSFFITSHVTSGLLKRHALRVPVDYNVDASTSSQTSSSQCPLVSLLPTTHHPPPPSPSRCYGCWHPCKQTSHRTNEPNWHWPDSSFPFYSPPIPTSHRSHAVRLGLRSVCPHV